MTPPTLPDALTTIIQSAVFISSIIVLMLAEPAINKMSPCTRFVPRLAYHLLVVGAAGNILWLLLGDTPNWPESIIISGIALLLICDKFMPRSSSGPTAPQALRTAGERKLAPGTLPPSNLV